MPEKIYLPHKLFDGNNFCKNTAVLVKNGIIKNLIPKDNLPSTQNIIPLKNTILAPAYKDLQINGALGLMFSTSPSVKALKALYKYSAKGGATGFMATLPTNSNEVIKKAIKAVKDYWAQDLPGLLGLHLEGPYINPIKKGAHKEELIVKPTINHIKELINYGKETIKMITLAPECCSDEVLDFLTKQDILLSAGHSNATYNQAKYAFSKGVQTCTHLYNAMSSFSHRKPGLVGAIFDSKITSGIIPDKVHTSAAAFRIASQVMGDRLYYVTDAITETKTEHYEYIFKEDRYVTEKGILAGSCLTMDKAVQKAIEMGTKPKDALKRASAIPSKVIGKSARWGKIAPGYEMDWVLLDEHYNAKKVLTK